MAQVATITRSRETEQVVYPHTCGRTNDSLGYDLTYTGSGTDGFKRSQHTMDEWNESNRQNRYAAFTDREDAVHTTLSADDVVRNSVEAEQRMQAKNTEKLAERLKDINYWKSELNRQISDMITETDLLVSDKRRMEKALRTIEIPLYIATDNLNVRQRRQGIDLVQDDVEICLLKEIEIINNAQDLLKRTIKEAEQQIKRNRDQKQNLEMDWSDKKEAGGIDAFCVRLRNEDTCKQFYPDAARFQENQSTPDSWAKFSHDNICSAEKERLASIQLRGLIENILHDIARDISAQGEAVDTALRRRIEQTQEEKARLEEELEKVCKVIVDAEKAVNAIKIAIRTKDDPMKVAQTRLHQREYRPNVELCRDPAQYGLIEEVNLLQKSYEYLYEKLAEAEKRLEALQNRRVALERDISHKKNTLFIDREKCLPRRTRYPTGLQLQGF